MILFLLNKSKETIRRVALAIGTLIAACPGVSYGWLSTKQLERGKFLALKENQGNYGTKMDITTEMKSDLRWWVDKIDTAKNSIKDNRYKLEIFTDASITGWGAYCNGEKAHGWWRAEEKHTLTFSN